MQAWEWPGPNGFTCGAIAEDANTGEQITCGLRFNHKDLTHHWESSERDGVIRSVSWMANGKVTIVGTFSQ